MVAAQTGRLEVGLAMSALGQKQTLAVVRLRSALPPIADMDQQGCEVRFVPKADILSNDTVIRSPRRRQRAGVPVHQGQVPWQS